MRSRVAALAVAFAIGSLVSGVAFAAVSRTIPNDGVFYACYDPGGNVRLIDYSATQKCPREWMGPVSWNQSGLSRAGIATFTSSHLIPGQPVVRAFVPTGSASPLCQATLSESSFAMAGISVFCGQRNFQDMDGALVTIFYPADGPWPQSSPDFSVTLVVNHDGAEYYGEPIYAW